MTDATVEDFRYSGLSTTNLRIGFIMTQQRAAEGEWGAQAALGALPFCAQFGECRSTMARFGDLLSEAIHRIRLCENNKPISVIHDELGYALGRSGGTAIAYWRKGRPPNVADLERLARELMRRSDLDGAWLMRFLRAANYPFPDSLVHELRPPAVASGDHDAQPNFAGATHLAFHAGHAEIVGRDEEQRILLALLHAPHGAPIVAIDGAGGMGKTALAYAVAATCARRKTFDVVVWVGANTGEADDVDALTLQRILRLLGRHLAPADFAQLPQTELNARLYALLRTRRVLIVLDSLEAAGDAQESIVQGLRPFLGVSRALVTSRRRFMGDVYALHLTGLDAEYSRRLIHQQAHLRGLPSLANAPDGDLQQIVAAAGGSPLAIKLIVGQLGFLPLEFVLARLRDNGLLVHQSRDDEYVHMYTNLFLPTWSQLSAAGQWLLVTLSLFVPGVGGALDAVSAISELASHHLYAALNELWRVSLLEVGPTQHDSLHDKRYYLHTLTRNFVQLAVDAAPDGVLRAERTRAGLDFINYYLTYATAHAHNQAALTSELDNLTTTLRMVHDMGQPDLLLLTAQAICPHLLQHGRHVEAIAHLVRAEAAARHEAAMQPLGAILFQLGVALHNYGRPEEAHARLDEALAIARRVGDQPLCCDILQALCESRGSA